MPDDKIVNTELTGPSSECKIGAENLMSVASNQITMTTTKVSTNIALNSISSGF